MNRFDAVTEAERMRAARTSGEIASGLNYTVGLPPMGGDTDYYVITIPAFR